jgi:hypothetical protein
LDFGAAGGGGLALRPCRGMPSACVRQVPLQYQNPNSVTCWAVRGDASLVP